MLYACLALIDEPTDKEKFTELYHKYKYSIHFTAKSIVHDEQLAEDILQEVFLYIAKNFKRLILDDGCKIGRYMILCAKSRALNMLQKRKRENTHCPETLDYIDEDFDDFGDSIEDAMIKAEDMKALMDAVSTLDDTYRIPLEFTARGRTSKEIAEIMNIQDSTVRKRIERGRKILWKKVQQDGKV